MYEESSDEGSARFSQTRERLFIYDSSSCRVIGVSRRLRPVGMRRQLEFERRKKVRRGTEIQRQLHVRERRAVGVPMQRHGTERQLFVRCRGALGLSVQRHGAEQNL